MGGTGAAGFTSAFTAHSQTSHAQGGACEGFGALGGAAAFPLPARKTATAKAARKDCFIVVVLLEMSD